MNKKILVFILAVVILPFVHPTEAQPQAEVAKIGWLGVRPAAPGSGSDVIRRMLRELGYIEGKNMTFEYRSVENDLDRLLAVADELVRLKVDVLVTSTTRGVLAARNATRTIPIVFFSVADPVAAGLVDSLARPRG